MPARRKPGPLVRITSIEIRVCQNTRAAMSDSEMRSGGKSTFDFLVITMKTDEGIAWAFLRFCRAGRGNGRERSRLRLLKPFFLGKDPLLREKHWQDFRTYDRWWNHVPIYSYGPFDICLYDIAATEGGLAALQDAGRVSRQSSDLRQLVCALHVPRIMRSKRSR